MLVAPAGCVRDCADLRVVNVHWFAKGMFV